MWNEMKEQPPFEGVVADIVMDLVQHEADNIRDLPQMKGELWFYHNCDNIHHNTLLRWNP